MMGVQNIRPFKENLKRMLLLYSLAPVFELLSVCAVLVLFVGCFIIAHHNKQVNGEIAQEIQMVLEHYELLAKDLSSSSDIVDPMMSSTKRQKIVRKIYSASLDTGYGAELYVLRSDGLLCAGVGSRQGSESYREKDTYRVMELLNSFPDQTAVCAVTLTGTKKLYLGRSVMEDLKPAGYVILAIPETEFTDLLSRHNQINIIADDTGWVFSESSSRFTDAVGRIQKEVGTRFGFLMLGGKCCYITGKELWGGVLKAYTITDNSDVVTLLFTVFLTSFGVMLFVVVISLSSAERLARQSTEDIVKINHAFGKVTDGNLTAYLDIHSSVEFENISRCYNEMLDSLKHQISKNRELAEAVAASQIRHLKSQFNSHFLFNTLDNIRFMCKIDADLAEFMTLSLSELLRYNTSYTNDKVTVEEDLKYIDIYLQIIKVRFRERFDFTVEIADTVKNKRIPKLLMQPLIENAVKYGFGHREHLAVQVFVWEENGKLLLLCRDDGVGIESSRLEKIRDSFSLPEKESPHMGLYNVYRRIILIYGESYGMQVESLYGTAVTLTLPLEEGESCDDTGSCGRG
jgi:signal transduction histidine kinase